MSAPEREDHPIESPVDQEAVASGPVASGPGESPEAPAEAPGAAETVSHGEIEPVAVEPSKDDDAPENAAAGETEDESADEGQKEPPTRPSSKRRRRTPRVQSPAEAKAVLECLLFATTEPLGLRQIREAIHPMDMKALQALVVELQNEYDQRGCGLQIVELAGGYQMATRPRYANWLVNFQKKKRRSGLSVAMLETLAIIAYKQPIIRAEIDAIRGVDSSGVVHSLQETGLIEVVGQKQVPGRPNLYGTTNDFLKYFGLKSLSDMPSIDALRERFDLPQG